MLPTVCSLCLKAHYWFGHMHHQLLSSQFNTTAAVVKAVLHLPMRLGLLPRSQAVISQGVMNSRLHSCGCCIGCSQLLASHPGNPPNAATTPPSGTAGVCVSHAMPCTDLHR